MSGGLYVFASAAEKGMLTALVPPRRPPGPSWFLGELGETPVSAWKVIRGQHHRTRRQHRRCPPPGLALLYAASFAASASLLTAIDPDTVASRAGGSGGKRGAATSRGLWAETEQGVR